MQLPMVSNLINSAQKGQQVNEILQMNDQSREFGLELTTKEVVQILETRNRYLTQIGRIEIGIEVSKAIILSFCNSSYIIPDEYVATINELHEVFYYMKNETDDKIGDDELVKIIKEGFEVCGGSMELLKGKLQTFADEFRKKKWKLNIDQRDGIN